MGDRAARRYDARVRRYFTPRCIGMHVTLLILLPVFAWLTWWQLGRALAGNTLSWAYTFEWPLFAGYAIYVWWQLIHDQTTAITRRVLPGGAGGPAGAVDHDQPGWALTGGRRKNVAIAASSAVDEEESPPPRAVRGADARGGRGASPVQSVPGRTGRRRRRLPAPVIDRSDGLVGSGQANRVGTSPTEVMCTGR
jgi:hypothetical protein